MGAASGQVPELVEKQTLLGQRSGTHASYRKAHAEHYRYYEQQQKQQYEAVQMPLV